MARPSDPKARIKLLAAAEIVFAAHGLEDAKVEDIAARAGLAKGSFYLHFKSKDEAFRQLVEMMLARLKAQIEALPEEIASGQSIQEVLDQWIEQDTEIFEFVWQNRAVVGLMLEGGRCAAYSHLVDGFCDEAASKTRRLLAFGIEAGFYRADLDVEVTAAFIAGAYDRLARQIVREPRRPDLPQLLRRVQDLVLRGVASPATLAQIAALPPPAGPGARRPRTTIAAGGTAAAPARFLPSRGAKSPAPPAKPEPRARKRVSR